MCERAHRLLLRACAVGDRVRFLDGLLDAASELYAWREREEGGANGAKGSAGEKGVRSGQKGTRARRGCEQGKGHGRVANEAMGIGD